MGKLTLILGGARSGKSAHAERLAKKRNSAITFIATATAGDDEMAARIRKHQSERPAGWVTREIPYGIASTLQANPPQTDVVLLDCVTFLVANLIMSNGENEPDESSVSAQAETEIKDLLEYIENTPADWIIVSNEVGLGLVPPYPLGRIYRDLLGRANQQLAARAGEVFWMVAGIPVPIHAYRE